MLSGSGGETGIYFRLTHSSRGAGRARLCGLVTAALVAALAGAARAQVSVGLAAASDYRYRGVSLSDNRPAVSLSLAYDHPSGFYLGGRLIAGKPYEHSAELLGYLAYGGFVVRPKPTLALDLGVLNYHLTNYRGRERKFDYTELYAGLIGEHLDAHVYYAPNYYESGIETLYTDLGGGFRPTSNLRLSAHVGVLTPVGGRDGPRARKVRYDFRAGATLDVGPAQLSLTWTKLTPPYVPRALGGEPSDRVAVGVAFFF
jgi:uncharacterized protein (TIGR02001 family)